jgi:hypothetical protein
MSHLRPTADCECARNLDMVDDADGFHRLECASLQPPFCREADKRDIMRTLQLTTEDAAQDALQRAQATGAILSLARTLQRACFYGRREYVGEFDPAPVYLTQATMILTHEELQLSVSAMVRSTREGR